MAKRKGHGTTLSYYHFGRTTLFASRFDQRFSYCLYVPESYEEQGTKCYPLVVLIHGTERAAQGYRDAFTDFAERHQVVVLCPLFPAGISEPGELHNYKFIEYRGIRFDAVLLEIVREVGELYRLEADGFLLHGFSGGGHFAHRFFYLHPERLRAVSIAAPGVVTLLDPETDWWRGVRDLEARFGRALNLEAMRRVSVQMLIGSEDTDTWEINDEGRPGFVRGLPVVGTTRPERLTALRESFEQHGIGVRYDVVSGVAHEGWGLVGAAQTFFGEVLGDSQTHNVAFPHLAKEVL